MSRAFYDTSENFHPYECDGPGRCRHCDRKRDDKHDPQTCALCDPAYDYGTAPAEDGGNNRKETEPSVP